jgi:hypothetical protein
MSGEDQQTGLGSAPKNKWPEVTRRELDMKPIDRLRPNSTTHMRVLDYLNGRLNYSERKMSAFYSRWSMNEARVQAFISLPDHEQALKNMNDMHEPPKVVSIIVPYSYATIMTISTYHLQTFAGRKPIFQVSTNKREAVGGAKNMEILLQYNADHNRFIAKLWQFLWDIQCYGPGILRTTWKNEKAMRTVWRDTPVGGFFSMGQTRKQKFREMRLVYSGNEVDNIDPYMFFPDPRVPMSQVNKRGEFCFWRNYEGKHTLKVMEAQGIFKYVDNCGAPPRDSRAMQTGRQLLTQGQESTVGLLSGGMADSAATNIQNFIQVDQGSVTIIPAELGLGESETPEKWMFAIGNKRQILQAEPLNLDHGMHPVCVAEPYALGYGFGQPGIADFIGPLQDTMSWYINSHIHNVRTALNNMFVADPSRIEMQDLKNPAPGKIIRVKQAGYGQDIQTMLQQLQVADVTRGHTADFELFMKLADGLTGVTDNIRGLQDSGGRKTATEVRTSGEAAASRLAAQSRVISAQALVDLTMQMSINLQQFLEEELYLQIVGQDGATNPIAIKPEHLVGDFHYPVNDGTLPIDRVAMLDVWKELYLGMAQNPQLAQQYDMTKIFEHVAELGGAKDIANFKIQMLPDEQIAAQAGAGNVIQIPGPLPGGRTPGTTPSPGQRLA